MDNYFIRYEPYSRRYKKYRVIKVGDKFAIEVKPTWSRKYIFDSSTLGKLHDTEQEALDVLKALAKRYAKSYDIEWKEQAEKEHSILYTIEYKKFKIKKALELGISEVLVEGRYNEEYRKSRWFDM